MLCIAVETDGQVQNLITELRVGATGRDWARRGASLTAVFALLVGTCLLFPGQANADLDFEPLPDTGVHTYCFDATYAPNSLVAERIDWSMGTLEAQTIVDTDFHQDGCTSQTDVRWQQRPIGDGYIGYTNCLNYNQNNRCDQWRVRIDYGLIQDAAVSPPAEVRHTACHELGHTATARHYGFGIPNPDTLGQSCMRSGVWDDGSERYRTYGPHHINHHMNDHWK